MVWKRFENYASAQRPEKKEKGKKNTLKLSNFLNKRNFSSLLFLYIIVRVYLYHRERI